MPILLMLSKGILRNVGKHQVKQMHHFVEHYFYFDIKKYFSVDQWKKWQKPQRFYLTLKGNSRDTAAIHEQTTVLRIAQIKP